MTRAVYRLDIYGSIFQHFRPPQNDLVIAEQSNHFFSQLKDSELEKFLCVQTYLLDELEGYLDQAEKVFV